MREIILKELFCQGFSKRALGKFPEKIYDEEDGVIEIKIIPFKEIFVEDLLRALRKYIDFSIIFRGDWSIKMEKSHKEEGNWEVFCFYKKKLVFYGKRDFSIKEKRDMFRGKIYLDNFPEPMKLYIIIKEGEYKEFEDVINALRERFIVLVDKGRSFEKVKKISREIGFDYVVIFDGMTKIDGKAIFYDVKLSREKRRDIAEFIS